MIEILSLWRNDEERHLFERAEHLLTKTATQDIVWLWGIGDSPDLTEDILRAVADGDPDVRIVRVDTGITGEDPGTRRERGSASASQLFHQLDPRADYAMLHESDLTSDADVAEQLLLAGDGAPMAGWPTIILDGTPRFYDIWAYRDMSGAMFLPSQPYSPQWHRAGPFPVTSFGSCWVVPAAMLRDRTIVTEAVVELCGQWIAEGYGLSCDPRIKIGQPADLWSAS